MRVVITGSRRWPKHAEELIRKELSRLTENSVIIQGGAAGADITAALLAFKEFNFEVITYPADWDLYGKAAGPIRNEKMLKEGKPDKCLCFPVESWAVSKGTHEM